MHVDLGPGHIVLDGLDGDPDAATEKGTAAPPPQLFGLSVVAKRWVVQNATRHRGRSWLKLHCVR